MSIKCKCLNYKGKDAFNNMDKQTFQGGRKEQQQKKKDFVSGKD